MSNEKDFTKWLTFAQIDLRTAKIILKNSKGDEYYRNVCFFCQQSVEKALKGVILFLEIDFPHVHDIYVLFTVLESKGYFIKEGLKEAGYLTQYATKERYPNDAFDITIDETEEAIEYAKQILKWAKKVTKDKNLLIK
jgi:HEPN domain-containing protein